MPLPQLVVPTYSLNLPSTGQEIQYRPFLVKEEKILLMALEGEEENEMLRAMIHIINNCLSTEIDLTSLPLFDLEYIFLNLRSKSIGEISNIVIRCQNLVENEICDEANEYTIDLKEVQVLSDDSHNNTIQLSETMGIVMKYPKIDLLAAAPPGAAEENQVNTFFNTIYDCIDVIYDGEETFTKDEYSYEELENFVDSLTQNQFQQINSFFETMPKMSYDLQYNCTKCKYSDIINLSSIDDFFG